MKFTTAFTIISTIATFTSVIAAPSQANQGMSAPKVKATFSTCSCGQPKPAAKCQSNAAPRPYSTLTPNTDNMFAKNKEFASTFTQGSLPIAPGKKLAVVTCIDARIDPNSALGFSIGDAHVIRNAGGDAREAMRSIVVSQQLLGTNELWIIKHKGCGMTTFNETIGKQVVEKNLGVDASELEFKTFPDPNQAVKDDLEFLRLSPLISSNITLSGFVYNTITGEVENVV